MYYVVTRYLFQQISFFSIVEDINYNKKAIFLKNIKLSFTMNIVSCLVNHVV